MIEKVVRIPTRIDNVNVGDILVRSVGVDGMEMMKVVIGKIDDEFVYCGSHTEEDKRNPFGPIPWEEGWKFRRSTGFEVDEELGFDGTNVALTYITEIIRQ